jgi:REP element-mobilizing transposase RayT
MSHWKLYYHFVWSTKNRLAVIDPVFESDLYRVIAAKAQEMEAFVHAIGGTEDHAHLVVSIPPKVAPAKFIGEVKGNSSHYVNHIIKPDFEFYWQDEYGVLSFGEKNMPSIVRYIQNQKKHHAEGNLIAAMERMEERQSALAGFVK